MLCLSKTNSKLILHNAYRRDLNLYGNVFALKLINSNKDLAMKYCPIQG